MRIDITYTPDDVCTLIENDLEKRHITTDLDYRTFKRVITEKVSGNIYIEGEI